MRLTWADEDKHYLTATSQKPSQNQKALSACYYHEVYEYNFFSNE